MLLPSWIKLRTQDEVNTCFRGMKGLKVGSSTCEGHIQPLTPLPERSQHRPQTAAKHESVMGKKNPKSSKRGTTKMKQNRKGEARKTHHKAW